MVGERNTHGQSRCEGVDAQTRGKQEQCRPACRHRPPESSRKLPRFPLAEKKSAYPITREALVEVVLASYHGICGSIGSTRLRALDFFGFGASYPKRAHAAGSIGIGLVRPVSRFTKLPEYFSDPVL